MERVTKVMRSLISYLSFPTYLRCWNPFGLAIHFFKLNIYFWYKIYKRLTITVSGKLVMNHLPIPDDILLHYGTTAVYNQSTRDCKNPIEDL